MKAISTEHDKDKYLNFQLINKLNIIAPPRKIKEITDGRILHLYDKYFIIRDIKTKMVVFFIRGKFEREYSSDYGDMFNDFIELKNKDLILWSKGKIFYYKKFGYAYKISQVINELKQQRNSREITQIGYLELYDLYNIIEFENNILISCNSLGIKIYNFVDNEYKYVKTIPMFLDVENMIKIKDNNFLIIHHYIYISGTCTPDTYQEFALSLFDLNSEKITNKLFYHKTKTDELGDSNYRFNYFLIGDNFIYQITDFSYEIEDIEEIKKISKDLSFNYNIYNVKTGNNILNLKTPFRLISYYKDNLVFAQDYESLKVCNFENNTFTEVYKFNFNNSNLCILKNHDFIVLTEKKRWEECQNNDGSTWKNYKGRFNYCDYYKYLLK